VGKKKKMVNGDFSFNEKKKGVGRPPARSSKYLAAPGAQVQEGKREETGKKPMKTNILDDKWG